mmetsp:Transcript_37643/g.121710  ORF Transcript_37643/g.121710 Transcript_37643/m.121710 type:complete len:233 (+) Transcript_37643:43-741(+)
MDGLDALLAEAAAEREVRRSPPPPVAAAAPRVAPVAPPPASHQPSSEAASELHAALKGYIEHLLCPDALDALSLALSSRKYAEVEEYIVARPELSRYTLSAEVGRLSYTVFPSGGGPPVTEPGAIRAYYARQSGDAGRGGGGGGGVAASSCGAAELLWRAANQSLFGEVLGSLQEAWLEPRLSTCVVATASSLRLDFRDAAQPRLDASCELAVQTLGASDEPLVLATTQAGT